MKILAVGGGSGGHITPIVAVVKELLVMQSNDLDVEVWTDHAFKTQLSEKLYDVGAGIKVDTVLSGKLRRYYGIPIWRQLFRLRTIVIPNVIDLIKLSLGTFQSIYKLLIFKPNVIFLKGGFVCLPVGVAAKILGVPFVLHDSDTHPGLTNRILARWARSIGTGAPLSYYKYPVSKSHYVGTPIDNRYKLPLADQVSYSKHNIGFNDSRPLIVATGGGLGSEVINNAVVHSLSTILSYANVILICGKSHYENLRKQTMELDSKKFRLEAFVGSQMVETLTAADIIVARAGATTLLELSALGKPAIIIPHPYLTGGHQIKNAAMYSSKDAAIILNENEIRSQPKLLSDQINSLLSNPSRMSDLGKAINQFTKSHAARDMALLILKTSK